MMIRTRRQSGAALVVSTFVAIGFLPMMSAGANSLITKKKFGNTADGQQVDLYTLSNKQGMEASIATYGATLVTLKVPDRTGKIDDVVLGYDTVDGYATGKSYFGGTIGRYGNRIARAKFTLDGEVYDLAKNDGPNSLHGGTIGFNKRLWNAREVSNPDGESLELSYLSKAGEEGYPGNLSVTVTYTLSRERNELKIEYHATTDKDTVLNLTNHSYFNLAGQGNGDILHHQVTLHASRFTPVDETLIPTGELRDVSGTPFDFLQPAEIGARIGQNDQQLKVGKGYDHNWVLDKESGADLLTSAAQAYDPQSGRVLEILTTEPGIQFYSGNFLDGSAHGKGRKSYGYRSGFCLETQHFPDSPNHPSFPTTELKPGQTKRSTTVLRFSTATR
jgi:aldose 1-epimerase